jgi:DNA-binding transcriptional MerR regulator
MLKIGEFARLGQVSIATLRHYDQYGLLKPSRSPAIVITRLTSFRA